MEIIYVMILYYIIIIFGTKDYTVEINMIRLLQNLKILYNRF